MLRAARPWSTRFSLLGSRNPKVRFLPLFLADFADLRRPADPLLGSAICELFETLSAIPTPAVQQILLLEALPALARTMAEIRFDPFSPRAASAMDIVESIFEGQPATLAEGAFATVALVLFEALGTTEDRDILQTGLHVITTVVRKDVDQLLNW